MALAKRAEGETGSAYGDIFRIRIWEEGYVGSADTLQFAKPGFTLEYQPNTNDISSPMIPSYAKFYLINDSAAMDTLISDIIANQQSTFYVEIERNTGAAYTHYWKGVLFQDEITEPDSPKPRPFVLSATDGLNLLQAVDYDFANTVSSSLNNPAHTPIINILDKCLEQALDQTLWGGSDDYLVTSVDWWETDQTYSATADPLGDLVIDVLGFREVKTNPGNELFPYPWDPNTPIYGPETLEVEYLTCYEVLEQLARLFLCRVYQYNGAWHFEQIPLRAAATTKRMKYTTSLGTPTYSKPNTFTTIDQTRRKTRVAGNQTQYIPALKKVQATYDAYGGNSSNRLILGTDNLSNSVSRSYGLFSDAYFLSAAGTNVSQNIYLQFLFLANGSFTYSSASWRYISPTLYTLRLRLQIEVTLKITDAYSSTEYWWDGSAWVTSADTFFVNSGYAELQSNSPGSGTFFIKSGDLGDRVINTSYIPCTGIVSITLDNPLWQIQNTGFPVAWSTATMASIGGGVYMSLKTLLDRSDTSFLYSVTNPNTAINDYEIYTYPKINIADKALQGGHIMFDNGSSIESCTEWEVAQDGNNVTLLALLVQQRLAIQSEPTPKYQGQVMFPEGYGEGIAFDSTFWLPHDYNFSAHDGTVDGTWHKVAIYASLGNPSEDPADPSRIGAFAMRSANTPELNNRLNDLISVVDVDPEGDRMALGLPVRTSGLERETQVINAEAASSDTLAYTDHVVFLDWTGGDGTFTLNLPAVVTGVEFVIITDSTITAARDIAITPDGAETINGSAELTITGAGMITIRAANGEWHGY